MIFDRDASRECKICGIKSNDRQIWNGIYCGKTSETVSLLILFLDNASFDTDVALGLCGFPDLGNFFSWKYRMNYDILIIEETDIGGVETAEKNNIKPDTILKTFWRDNDHFADLFNAALFDGEQLLNPADLMEADTDVSSMVKFNNHAETVQKVLDVVKKTAYGVGFVI